MIGADLPVPLVDIGRGLRDAFDMFWDTLWPLVLGFTLSGAVQAFATPGAMERRLGNHRPAAVTRASAYGMASSSCSYAASAMAKSLFARGADFVAAMVFMFASTNLVVELGIVLIVLLGWQFAASEGVGGVLMIVLLATLGALVLRGPAVAAARRRVTQPRASAGQAHEQHQAAGPAPATPPPAPEAVAVAPPLRQRLRSPAGWTDAARYTMADLSMLRREIMIGFLIAGFLIALVPASAWQALFVTGHGPWTDVQNALIGPFIAIISCVCSVGNVALAAALWQGGIAFGGVVSFIFADLIALPLLFIYRRLYGTRLTLRMLVVFWVLMSAAGLVTQALFQAAGLVPTDRHIASISSGPGWGVTTYLDLMALAVLGAMVWLSRRPPAIATGTHATDPVCGMQVRAADAPASIEENGRTVFFCSDRCRDRYRAGAVPEDPRRPAIRPAGDIHH